MRILHVVPSYLPATRYGGPIYSVHGLCKALAARGHDVQVFTTNVDGARESDVPLGRPVALDGVNVWYFPSRRLRRLYWSPPMMAALKRETGRFDVVHLHSVYLWPTWAAARAAGRVGIPFVVSPRGMLVKDLIRRRSRWLKSAWIRLIERRTLERSARVHVTSALEADELVRFGFRLPPVVTIPNGVEPPSAWSESTVSSDVAELLRRRPLVLFLGRISWKKGLDRLLRSIGWLPEWCCLVIIGNDEEDYLPELQRIAESEGLGDRVRFLPRSVHGADKEALFAAARVFVLPSYSENFGNTVLEAMIRGCPVVVTEEVGAAEVVRAAGGGRVVDAAGLSDALEELIADEALAERLGVAARAFAMKHYLWAGVAGRMEAMYREVAACNDVPGNA